MYGESFQTQLGYKMCDCISNKDNVAENNLCAEIIKVNITQKCQTCIKYYFRIKILLNKISVKSFQVQSNNKNTQTVAKTELNEKIQTECLRRKHNFHKTPTKAKPLQDTGENKRNYNEICSIQTKRRHIV